MRRIIKKKINNSRLLSSFTKDLQTYFTKDLQTYFKYFESIENKKR